MSIAHAEIVARALRGALLSHAIDPPPAPLSGHAADGRHLERTHAAFLALPDLQTGAVRDAAIALPRDIDPEERLQILLAADRWERGGLRLLLGRLGAIQLARVDAPATPVATGPSDWIGPSKRWATVTPIALHHNPGDLTARDPAKRSRAARYAEEIVSRGCAHICLSRPIRVRISRRSPFASLPSAPEFMPFPRKAGGPGSSRLQRVCVHAELEFAKPVEGPVLLGAGRYFGVGLCGVR